MNVFIVEDEAANLKLFELVLSAEGYMVSGSGDPQRALKAIQVDMPDVVLMDLSLPGKSGLELTRILKQDPATRQITVIAITGHPELFSRKDALEAGCDAYLVKPIDTQILTQQVKEAVSGKSK
jgi:CheY-like chemotaxis protein